MTARGAADGRFVYLTTDRSWVLIGQYLEIRDNQGLTRESTKKRKKVG